MDNKLLEKIEEYLIYLNSIEKKNEYRDIISNIKNRNNSISIGLLGSYSSGKSTLINALLGKKILPSEQIATTGAITKIKYSTNENIKVILKTKNEMIDILYNYRKYLLDEIRSTGEYIEIIDSKYLEEDIKLGILKLKKEDLKKYNDFQQNSNNSEKKEFFHISSIHSYPQHNFVKYFKCKNSEKKVTINSLVKNSSSEFLNLRKKYEIIMENINNNEILLNADDTLKQYCESNFPCEIIKEIIVETNELKLGSNVELIDLPGLDVSNQNHMKITKEIADTVSAFIIIEDEKVTEGSTKNIVEEIKKKFPQMFNLCYLIKNKYDSILRDKRNLQEREEIFEKTRSNLNIPCEKTFKLSALEVLESFEKNKIDQNPYVAEFNLFKRRLLEDVKDLEKNFKIEIRKALIPIKNNLIKDIEKNIKENRFALDDDNNSLKIYLSKVAKDEFKKYSITCKDKINQLAIKSCKSLVKWSIKNNTNIVNEIFNDINSKSESYYEDLAKIGKDINISTPNKICSIYENEIQLNYKIRKEYYKFIEDDFYIKLKENLETDFLDSEFKKYMSEEMIKKLSSYTSNIKLLDRLSGIIDITLLNYQDDIENIKSVVVYSITCLNNNKEDLNLKFSKEEIHSNYNLNELSSCKEIYDKIFKKEIENYLNSNCLENINIYTNVIIKNYLHEITIFLNSCLEEELYGIKFEENYKEIENKNLEMKFQKIKEKVTKLEEIKNELEAI